MEDCAAFPCIIHHLCKRLLTVLLILVALFNGIFWLGRADRAGIREGHLVASPVQRWPSVYLRIALGYVRVMGLPKDSVDWPTVFDRAKNQIKNAKTPAARIRRSAQRSKRRRGRGAAEPGAAAGPGGDGRART